MLTYSISASSPENKSQKYRTCCACAVCRGENGHCRSTRRQEKLASTGAEVLDIYNFLSLRVLESLIHTQSAEISRIL